MFYEKFQIVLVKQLQETLKIYDRDQKRRENEELRKKRLAYVGISLDNVLPGGHQPREKKEDESESESSESSRSDSESGLDSDEPVYQLRERRQGTTSYRFNEYDELINSAIRVSSKVECLQRSLVHNGLFVHLLQSKISSNK